jgi:hypothetical protein
LKTGGRGEGTMRGGCPRIPHAYARERVLKNPVFARFPFVYGFQLCFRYEYTPKPKTARCGEGKQPFFLSVTFTLYWVCQLCHIWHVCQFVGVTLSRLAECRFVTLSYLCHIWHSFVSRKMWHFGRNVAEFVNKC